MSAPPLFAATAHVTGITALIVVVAVLLPIVIGIVTVVRAGARKARKEI